MEELAAWGLPPRATIAELRGAIEARGGSCRGCKLKADYVRRLREVQARGGAAPAGSPAAGAAPGEGFGSLPSPGAGTPAPATAAAGGEPGGAGRPTPAPESAAKRERMERARTGRSAPLMVPTGTPRQQPLPAAPAPAPAGAPALAPASAAATTTRLAQPVGASPAKAGKRAAPRGLGLGGSFLVGGFLALLAALALGGVLQPHAAALAPVLARLKALEYAAAQAMAAANTAYAEAHQKNLAEIGSAGGEEEEPEVPKSSPGHAALLGLQKVAPEVPKWAGVSEAVLAQKDSQWRSWGTRKAVAVAVGATYGRKDASLAQRLGMEGHECLLVVHPNFRKMGEGKNGTMEVLDERPWEAADLQKELVTFLKRCPAGAVILRDVARMSSQAINPLHTAMSEGGSFLDDGTKVPAWDAVFLLEFRTNWNQEWLHDVPRCTTYVKDAVIGPWGGHSMGGTIHERAMAFRRRIDFVIPIR